MSSSTWTNKYIDDATNDDDDDEDWSSPYTIIEQRTAAICAIVRDEDLYLDEWVLYHLGIGFTQIFIFDNSEKESTRRWFVWATNTTTMSRTSRDIIRRGVTVVPFGSKARRRQLDAYEECVKDYIQPQNYTWVGFFDPDEYLVIHQHENTTTTTTTTTKLTAITTPMSVPDFLAKYCPEGSLGINWFVFGTSNQTNYEPLPVTFRFQYRHRVDDHVKTIVKVSHFKNFRSPHWAYWTDDTLRKDTNGNWIPGARMPNNPGVQNPTFHPNGPTDVAVFHHYSVKSVEEYTWKVCVRGDVFDNSGCGVGNFSLSNFSPGYIHDDTAWKILKQSVSQYHRWSKDIDGK